MAGIKITRKEIKRDELATTIGDIRVGLEQNLRGVVITVGALIVLSVAVVGGIWWSRSRANEAKTMLAAVQTASGAPVAGEGIAGQSAGAYPSQSAKYEEVARLADKVVAEHPSSSAAKWAAYYKAVARKETKNYAEALSLLAPLASDTSDDFLAASAKLLQAQVHEAQGDPAGALEIYASLATSAPSPFPVDMVLANQARLLEGQGKADEARDIHRRISQEYPDSPYNRQAGERAGPPRG